MCDTIYVNRINWFIHIFLNQEVVGKTDRTGDKTLNLQQFFAMSFGLSVESFYYIAIAVLACILGAEIAGICMLIGKMRRARNGEDEAPVDEYDNHGGANYAIAALSFGAVSATAELVLLVLAIAALVGAFVLCLLLVILYAKGYLLISAKAAKEAEAREQAEKEAAREAARKAAEAAVAVSAAEEPSYSGDDHSAQEDPYADDYADDKAAQDAISNLIATENAVMAEEYEEEDTVDEAPEAVETAVVAADPNAPAVQVTQTVERTVLSEGAPAYAGQAPIVEKHIIEKTKEIIKETNTTTVNTVPAEGKAEQQFSPATEEMMKAITEFMKLETQLRMEREVAVERSVSENGESTPAFAEGEDEDIEVDEIDTEDELDAEDEAQREADAEENDDEYESDLFGNERIVGFDEETGCYIIARYRKSCEAKLMQSRPATKKYYSAIRNALMGYEGTKERMSWTIDTYTNEHTQIAKINVRPRTLDLYLALEPSTLEDSIYRGRDVSAKKKYAETPFLYKVNSPRKLTLALELVQRACEEQGLSPIDIEEINYEEQYPFTDTETLITRGLIREYLREEKPAATFELDPDHVPQLIEEDETVIPANANFTWEFDNDQPEVEEEPVVEEEPAPEEPIAEEPVIEEEPVVEEPAPEEPAPAVPVMGTTTTTTTHETIRTTERHYTERHYATGTEAQVSEETRTIEVLPEPAATPIEVEAEEIAPEVAEEPVVEEQPTEEAHVEDAVEDTTEETVEETVEDVAEETEEETVEPTVEEEETVEEIEEEIIDDEIEEEIEETTDEQIAQMQNAVAALFGDDILEEDEPIEEEAAPEVTEEVIEEEVAEEEAVEEEVVEDEPVEEIIEEEVIDEEPEAEAEAEEEVYEEESEAEAEAEEEVYEEEYYEEQPEAEAEEEVYEEEYYEEEPEAEAEEEVYEEEYYEEQPEAEAEEEYYEEEYYEEEPAEGTEEVYEEVEGEEFEETYEEEVEEIEEEVEEEPAPAPAPAPQPASDVVLLDVCLFDDYFDNGAIVNLETLKQVGLAPESATRLKVYASGALKGQFTVEANHFTLDAIKAIGDADGDSIMIR